MSLQDLGWHAFFENQFEKQNNNRAGRVTNIQKSSLLILDQDGERAAKPCGALSHHMESTGDSLAVGDWIAYTWQPGDDYAMVQHILQRQNAITRMAAGSRSRQDDAAGKRQVMAANVDLVFIVSGLDRDFNLRRIERYLALVYESDARPVIVLNKADLCPDPEQKRAAVESVAVGVPVVVMNARDVSRGISCRAIPPVFWGRQVRVNRRSSTACWAGRGRKPVR
jgi:ribosome biogenesis GTPase